MIALYIFLGLLAVLFALTLVPIKAEFSYLRGFRVEVGYLFFRKTVFRSGGKGSRVNREPSPEKVKKKKKKEKPEEELVRPPLNELVPAAAAAAKKTFKRLGRSAKLVKARFRCCVATDDPAKTALVYGAVSGAAGDIYAFLVNLKRRSKKCGALDFKVESDFIAEDFDIDVEIIVSAIPLLLGVAALTGWIEFKKIKKLFRGKPETASQNEEEQQSKENEK